MKHQPAARHSAFYWRDQPSTIAQLVAPSPMDRSATAKDARYSPIPENLAAGQKSTDKRAALRRGTI